MTLKNPFSNNIPVKNSKESLAIFKYLSLSVTSKAFNREKGRIALA
jgi:hypothetical protein